MASWKNKNIRDMKITTGSGTDVKETEMLKGEAKPTRAWNSTNETVEYESGSSGSRGPYGGKNSGA